MSKCTDFSLYGTKYEDKDCLKCHKYRDCNQAYARKRLEESEDVSHTQELTSTVNVEPTLSPTDFNEASSSRKLDRCGNISVSQLSPSVSGNRMATCGSPSSFPLLRHSPEQPKI